MGITILYAVPTGAENLKLKDNIVQFVGKVKK